MLTLAVGQELITNNAVTQDHLVELVEFNRAAISAEIDEAHRSELGQFLTPYPIAHLMASMLTSRPAELKILDAGAGIGSLTAALIEQIPSWNERPKIVNVTAYEIDPIMVQYLLETLRACETLCKSLGIEFTYHIQQEDFISSAAGLLGQAGELFSRFTTPFNCAILNPPYRKINTASETRRQLESIGIRANNMYSAFTWLAMKLLAPNGELVAITPRSFCNGPYFRPFRLALLDSMSIARAHVFEFRDKAFADDDVLQENIILHAHKAQSQAQKVIISTSIGASDVTQRIVEYSQFVKPGDQDAFLHIVPNNLSHQISQQISELDATLEDLRLSVSTGRVVDFRSTHLVKQHTDMQDIPLIYPGNFADGYIAWPSERVRKPNALKQMAEVDELVIQSGFYVLVKRFSAKEEKRRIVAAVFDPGRVPTNRVGFENHINFFHRNNGGLPERLAKGLAAFLNSTLVDEYFRQFSGHTQVNATDLRSLKYPDSEKLLVLGTKIGEAFPGQEDLDRIIKEVLTLATNNDGSTFNAVEARQRIAEALSILKALGLPRAQQNDRSALTLLALLDMKPDTRWNEAANPLVGITEMMDYFKEHFGIDYAPNTRETVRRQTIHQFVETGIALINPDDLKRPTNSPNTRYQIEPEALKLILTYGTDAWNKSLSAYIKSAVALSNLYEKQREMYQIPVSLPNGEEVQLTAGGQNVLIKQVIEEFCPRYTPGGLVVYLGDAGDKLNESEKAYLAELGVAVDEHGKMPDVVVHMVDRNWLVLIEAVTSHGPIDIKRHNELKHVFGPSSAGLVYVTAFLTRRAMVKYLSDIDWETEVWVAESPSHLIHFNGERFLGPYDE